MTLIEKISKLFRRVFNKEKSCCAGFAHPRCDGPGGSRGHTNVFCYNGYKHRGTVPVFSDTVF